MATIQFISRESLPNKRTGTRLTLKCMLAGNEAEFGAQFNFFSDGRLAEVFCRPFKTGSELEEQLDRFCIAVSIALQHGASIAEMAKIMGDDKSEGLGNIFGAIVRAGAELDPHMPPDPAAGSAVAA